MAAIQTEGQLCSLALLYVGSRQLVDDLNEDSTEAQLCAALYSQARNHTLEAFWWKFATRRSVLALSTQTRTAWTYAYALPADYLAARYIHPGSRAIAARGRIPFDLELNDAGTDLLLLTDQPSAEFVYTAEVTNPARFPPSFVEAVAWNLAARLALGLPVKPQIGLAMQQGYRKALGEAVASGARQAQEDVEPDSEYITVR